MSKLIVFDPPMCCKSGICGEYPNFELVNFASDLEWLKAHGIQVERYGLSLEPSEFSKNEEVRKLLDLEGNECLPIIMFENKIVFKGNYVSRVNLADICNIPYDDNDAPPIHREENCCCGIDCDCTVPKHEKNSEDKTK